MKTNPSGILLRNESIHQRRGDAPELEARLTVDPCDPVAAAQLEELHLARGDYRALVRLLLRRAESLPSRIDRAEELGRAANLYRTRLGEPDAALEVAAAAFAQDAGNPQVADELDAIVCATGDFARARAIYAEAALAHQVGNPGLASLLWLRVAGLHVLGRSEPGAVQAALGRIGEATLGRAAPHLDLVERMADGVDVLDALVELSERIGDRARALRVRLRALSLTTEPARRAERHHAVAELYFRAGDAQAAEWHWIEALEAEPHRSATLTALLGLYRARGELAKAADLLERAGARSGNRSKRAQLSAEAAAICAHDLAQNTRAERLYSAALADDPDHLGAARALVDRYYAEARWPELEPLIELCARRAAGHGVGSAEVFFRAGHCSLELGRQARAVRHFRAALAVEPVHLPSLLGAARGSAGLGDFAGAHDFFDAALAVQRSLARPGGELAETLFAMGEAREKCDQVEAALTLYESALDLDPTHAGALAQATRLHEERGAPAKAARLLRVAVARSSDDARHEHMIALAQISTRALREPLAAIELYRRVVESRPRDRKIWLELAELYSAAELWAEAATAAERLGELEAKPHRRAKFFHVAANLARDRVDPVTAVRLYERALDAYFAPGCEILDRERRACLAPFRDCEHALRVRREWKLLERVYRGMIKRIGPKAPEQAELWHRLGRLCHKHLGHKSAAIQSFEVAAALDEGRLTNHRVLIDLYAEVGGDEIDKIIARRKRLLEVEPSNPEHYSALRNLYVKTRDFDRTFLMCRALVFLGRASAKEDEFHRKNRPGAVTWPRIPLSDEQWSRLRHPGEDPLIGQILGTVAEPIALDRATTARKLKLKDDRSSYHDHLRHLFRHVATSLGLGGLACVVQPGLAGDVVLANLLRDGRLQPTFALGRHLSEGQSSMQMAAILGRALTYARSAYYLRWLLSPTDELGAAFDAALRLCGADGERRPTTATIEEPFLDLLRRRLQPAWRAQLKGFVISYLGRGREASLETWGRAVDATARRAGLLLSGDLQVAADAIVREPIFATRTSWEERVRDLVVHSVSDEHAGLRRELGLALQDPG